jgi:hypothetical protein
MDSNEMCIPIIDGQCCSSVLSVQTDFFYRLNEKINRSVAIGWIDFVGMHLFQKGTSSVFFGRDFSRRKTNRS